MIECLGLKSSGSIWVFCLVINLSRKNVFYSFLFEQLLDQTFLWSIDKIIKGLIIQWLADRIADWQSDWPTGWPTHWPLTETNVWFMDELIGHCFVGLLLFSWAKVLNFLLEMDKPMSTHKASEQQTKVSIEKSRGFGKGRETGRHGRKGGVG